VRRTGRAAAVALALQFVAASTAPAAVSAAHSASGRRAAVAARAFAHQRPRFQVPFPCGDRRQGATYEGHGGGPGNAFALDFNRGSGNADEGDPVVASAAGRVRLVTRRDGALIVVIRHNAVWSTDYRHLSEFSVADGARVVRGQQIGRVGRTGTDFAHLHYEQQRHGRAVPIRFDGAPLDPDYSFTYNGPTYTSRNC
jgi:murein DD-endopeptidase MepM/ murein hydrolase activator NlpD